jgi:hypothetical protein
MEKLHRPEEILTFAGGDFVMSASRASHLIPGLVEETSTGLYRRAYTDTRKEMLRITAALHRLGIKV